MRAIALAALVLVGVLGLLTAYTLVHNGVDLLALVSLLVLAVLGFGIFGALRSHSRP
jgi:ABC-type sulfate transport system permease component